MVHHNIGGTVTNKYYHDNKKGKDERATGQRQQQQTQQLPAKSTKYGAWGPVYKNKQNFVNMHIC